MLFFIPACSNGMGSLIEDYNSNFTPEDFNWPAPGDDYFVSAEMLYDEYFLYDDSMLILAAPPGSKEAYWTFTDPDNGYEEVSVTVRAGQDPWGRTVYFTGTTYEGKSLILYVPESNLEGPKTYKLTLLVTDEGGGTYTDSCGIVIYKRYDR